MDLKGTPIGERILALHAEMVAQKQQKASEAEQEGRARREAEHKRALEREPVELISKLLKTRRDDIDKFPAKEVNQGHIKERKCGTVLFDLKPSEDGLSLQLGINSLFLAGVADKAGVDLSIEVTDAVQNTSSWYLSTVDLNHQHNDIGQCFRVYEYYNEPNSANSHRPVGEEYAYIVGAIYEAAEVAGIETLPKELPADEIPA